MVTEKECKVLQDQNEKSRSAVLDAIKIDIEKAKQKVEIKRLNAPKIVYPDNLPVSLKKMSF